MPHWPWRLERERAGQQLVGLAARSGTSRRFRRDAGRDASCSSGLGSNRSIWLGPPFCMSRITALARGAEVTGPGREIMAEHGAVFGRLGDCANRPGPAAQAQAGIVPTLAGVRMRIGRLAPTSRIGNSLVLSSIWQKSSHNCRAPGCVGLISAERYCVRPAARAGSELQATSWASVAGPARSGRQIDSAVSPDAAAASQNVRQESRPARRQVYRSASSDCNTTADEPGGYSWRHHGWSKALKRWMVPRRRTGTDCGRDGPLDLPASPG